MWIGFKSEELIKNLENYIIDGKDLDGINRI